MLYELGCRWKKRVCDLYNVVVSETVQETVYSVWWYIVVRTQSFFVVFEKKQTYNTNVINHLTVVFLI